MVTWLSCKQRNEVRFLGRAFQRVVAALARAWGRSVFPPRSGERGYDEIVGPRGVTDGIRPSEGRRPGSTPGEDIQKQDRSASVPVAPRSSKPRDKVRFLGGAFWKRLALRV